MELPVKKLLWPWVFLPLTALDWWIAWSRLPERVGMKFGPNGLPTSWATREQALTFDLVFLAVILGVTTVLPLGLTVAQPEKAWPAFIISWVVSTFLFVALNGVLWHYQVP